MTSRSLALVVVAAALVACGRPEAETHVPAPPESLSQVPQEAVPVEIPADVIQMRDALLKSAKAGSLSGLARMADANPDFVSNFGGTPHKQFWDLLRRTGIDPNLKLRNLFELPAGVRVVDGVTWYVWPDLAARDSQQLIPEKLSFQDRKRLADLIGEDGISRIREGEGYPGMRTAIAEDGRWVYFVLGQDGED